MVVVGMVEEELGRDCSVDVLGAGVETARCRLAFSGLNRTEDALLRDIDRFVPAHASAAVPSGLGFVEEPAVELGSVDVCGRRGDCWRRRPPPSLEEGRREPEAPAAVARRYAPPIPDPASPSFRTVSLSRS